MESRRAADPAHLLVGVVLGADPATAATFLAGIEPDLEGLGDRARVLLVSSDAEVRALATRWAAAHAPTVELVDGPDDLIEGRNAVLTAPLPTGWPAAQTWVHVPDVRDLPLPGAWKRYLEGATALPEAAVLRGVSAEDAGSEALHLVDLRRQPELAPTLLRDSAVRADLLGSAGPRLDARLAAGFADARLLAGALRAASAPTVAWVPGAAYVFGERDDELTGGRSSFADPRRFVESLRDGHLVVLGDDAPPWAQHMVLSDLQWYFRADEALSGQMNAEMHHLSTEFHALLSQVCARLSTDVLDEAQVPPVRRAAIEHGLRGRTWHEETALLEARDRPRRLVRLAYLFTGDLPAEEILVDGAPSRPRWAKTRSHAYAGRTLVSERILWVQHGQDVRLELDGATVRVARTRPREPRRRWTAAAVAAAFAPRKEAPSLTPGQQARKLASPSWWREKLVLMLAGTGAVRRRFAGAWVLLDRVESANDNAEHLFAHLRRTRPDHRAFFAVERGTADWKRLRADHGAQVLAYGSLRWKLVCLNATHVLSSQAGPYVSNPEALRPFGRRSWKFVFLQHGVIATDLSRWLNRRTFDLFVTSTPAEFASIAGDGGLYRYTPREVVLTGLPRHDRLVSLDRSGSVRQDRLLLVPSWREYLLVGQADATGRRALREDFEQTHYARAWWGLLRSEELRAFASDHGLRIAFMPHPNIQPYLASLDVPDHVEVLTYAGNDIQEVLVSARVVVTDFSSIVFDTALIRRPMAYYQFDQAEAFGGTHTVRQGYFGYPEDGFGPVVETEEALLAALRDIAQDGFELSPLYQERAAAAFPAPDDGACERVLHAVHELDTPTSDAPVAVPPSPPNRPTPRVPAVPGTGGREAAGRAFGSL